MSKIKAISEKELNRFAAKRYHMLKPDNPAIEPLAFIECINLFEIDTLMQLLPKNNGNKRRLRFQLKWFIKAVETELQLAIDNPYDRGSKSRDRFVEEGTSSFHLND